MCLRIFAAGGSVLRLLAGVFLVTLCAVDLAEAGRRDDRDFRQAWREQRRLDREDRRESVRTETRSNSQNPQSVKSPEPSRDAATTGGKRDGDQRSGATSASREKDEDRGKRREIKDEDGDGAPDTIADLFKSWSKGSADRLPDKPQAPINAAPSAPVGKGKAVAPAPSAPVAAAAAPAAGWGGKVMPAGQKAGSTLDLPQMPIRRGELLAANLSPRAMAKARELGYVVAPAEQLPNLGMALSRLVLPPNADPAQALELLKPVAGSSLLAFNTVYRPIRAATEDPAAPTATPALPAKGCASGRCYGAQSIKWQPQLSGCARRVRVGVIDTGIDAAHPTFKRRINVGNVQQGTRPAKGVAHGTGVLAIMAGDPESATPGLIPEAEFFAIDIFYADASGAPVSDTAHLLRALDMLEAWDVRVINLSLTGPRDDLVAEAITRLARKNVLMVAAAGNDGPAAEPAYPAGYPEVIAVTAVNRDQRSYRLANHGDYIDVAAPGVDIWTALPNEKQGNLSGTSLATPFVSAVIAGMYEGLPKKTKAAALAGLAYVDLGEPGRDRVFGNGLIVAPSSCRAPEAEVAQARKPVPEPGSGPAIWPTATKSARPASASGLGFTPQ